MHGNDELIAMLCYDELDIPMCMMHVGGVAVRRLLQPSSCKRVSRISQRSILRGLRFVLVGLGGTD